MIRGLSRAVQMPWAQSSAFRSAVLWLLRSPNENLALSCWLSQKRCRMLEFPAESSPHISRRPARQAALHTQAKLPKLAQSHRPLSRVTDSLCTLLQLDLFGNVQPQGPKSSAPPTATARSAAPSQHQLQRRPQHQHQQHQQHQHQQRTSA